MTKILVIYDSRTGNTKKMALAVAEGANQVAGTQVITKNVDSAKNRDLLDADGIIFGSPTYFGGMTGKMKEFIDRSIKVHGKLIGKVGGAFTSSGGTACGAETTLLSILQAMFIHGMIIQGRHDDKHYGAASVESPGKDEIDYCRELGKRVATLVSRLKR